jgi:hypothetical protein
MVGLDIVEEGTFANGRWVPGRQLAGDDTIEGDCLELKWPRKSATPAPLSRMTTEGIQRFTLYRYR